VLGAPSPVRLLAVGFAAIVAVLAFAGPAPGPSALLVAREADAPRARAAAVAGVAVHLRALARIARANGHRRSAATPGYDASVDYVAGRLEQAGYQVTRHEFRFPFFRLLGRPLLRSGGRTLRGGGESLRAMDYTPGGRVTGTLRRLGVACSPEEAGALQRGEIALVRRGECTFRRKARVAEQRGAAGLLIGGRAGETAVQGTLGGPGVTIPVLAVSAVAAADLTDRARARMVVRAVSERRRQVNVIAGMAGHEERRVAMMGAHLDSVPEGPGLNDNGSGVAAVLDVAERLASDPARRDGVRFAFWGAEELGLFGSKRYVAGLGAAARRRIAAYINLDMVGSPRPRPMVYEGDDERVEQLLRQGLRRRGVRPSGTRLGGASDHAPFRRAGIAIGGLFTGASRRTDPCYHRRCDDLSNVDVDMVRDMAAAARHALAGLASSFRRTRK
jgi:hypothetical protein